MRRKNKIIAGGVAASFGLLLSTVGMSWAHDVTVSDGAIDDAKSTHLHHLHGDETGHLEPTSTNVAEVSRLALKNVEPGKIADVSVFKGYAYLAAWGGETCKYNGVHVVDIRNPAKPKEVSFVQAKEGSAPGEGVQALSINTSKFKGDILLTNNETCNEKTGFGGLNIYNITNPANPSALTEGYGDDIVPGQGKKKAHEIHSVFGWQAGNKAYAVIVDNDESADVDIVDITDPRKPQLIREYDLAVDFPQILQAAPANLVQVFHHDVIVKEIAGRQIMLISYWDGGYVKLDVTTPTAATYVGDSDFDTVDPELEFQAGVTEAPEGNAHQAEFTKDNAYILAADEDFSPLASESAADDSGAFFSLPGSGTPAIETGQTISGATVYAGRACIGDATPPAGDPNVVDIAVVVRGVCAFTEKAGVIDAVGGYDALLVVNREGGDACGELLMSIEGQIPSISVNRSVGYGLFDIAGFDESACLEGVGDELPGIDLGDVGDTVTLRSYFDGWGYVHLYSNNSGKLVELDTYAIPEAMQADKAEGFGDLSVHEVATSKVRADLAYLSYYAGGLRVIKIAGGQIQEVGAYIGAGGNNFWGVEAFEANGQEYIAMSDRDYGLIIFKYTGAA